MNIRQKIVCICRCWLLIPHIFQESWCVHKKYNIFMLHRNICFLHLLFMHSCGAIVFLNKLSTRHKEVLYMWNMSCYGCEWLQKIFKTHIVWIYEWNGMDSKYQQQNNKCGNLRHGMRMLRKISAMNDGWDAVLQRREQPSKKQSCLIY